jgi:hypothetical protein
MMNWKVCGRKRCIPAWKTMKAVSQDSRSSGRDLNPGLIEYDAGVLTLDCGLTYYDYYVSILIQKMVRPNTCLGIKCFWVPKCIRPGANCACLEICKFIYIYLLWDFL